MPLLKEWMVRRAYTNTIEKIPGVKSKVKNWSVEWLHVRVIEGSQTTLAKKNCFVSEWWRSTAEKGTGSRDHLL